MKPALSPRFFPLSGNRAGPAAEPPFTPILDNGLVGP